MTTTLTPTPHLAVPLRATVAAEWLKLRTLRAATVTVGIAIISSITLSALAVADQRQRWDAMTAPERADVDPISVALVGLLLATLVLGSLAVRTITAEHSTGMLRTTFAAIPHRRTILVTKAALVAVVAIAAAAVSNVIAVALGARILAATGLPIGFGEPGAVRAILLGALGVGLFAVIATALGALLRRATTANIVLALLVVGGQLIGAALPEDARRYLPSAALQALVTTHPTGETVSPTTGFLVLAAAAALVMVLATHVIARRDP